MYDIKLRSGLLEGVGVINGLSLDMIQDRILFSLLLSIGIVGTLRIQMLWREWSKLLLGLFQMYRYGFTADKSIHFSLSCSLVKVQRKIELHISG